MHLIASLESATSESVTLEPQIPTHLEPRRLMADAGFSKYFARDKETYQGPQSY